MFWGCVALGAILEVLGDVFFKKGTVPFGLLLYGIGTLFWAASLRYEQLSVAVTIFTLFNLVMGVVLGLWLFSEHLSIAQWIGVSLAGLSIFFLSA